MSKRLQKAVQAVTDAREELHTAIREAVESGQRVVDVAEATGYTRQRVYQIVGPKTERNPSREVMEARLAELDTRWELLVNEVAAVDKPPAEWIARETAKRNSRRGIEARRGLPARPTVLGEARAAAESKLLRTLHDHAQDPRIVTVLAEILEANRLRESLDSLNDRALGITD
jgi:DNA-binding phage protein